MGESHALLTEPNKMYPKDAEVKDMSKNLMSGDFERQCSNTMGKCERRREWLVVMAVGVGMLVMGLLVLTIVREVQLSQLQQKVDELSANMIAMSATIKSLNHKIDNNKFLNEFKDLEDTIYADEDLDVLPSTEENETDKDSLQKLHSLTVLEDDNMGDDEDLLDVDEAESGDWYPDYDRRREKIGTTNMVRLRPEDFTDTVLTVENNGKLVVPNIRELKKLINQNPENPDLPDLKTRPSLSNPEVLDDSTRDKRSLFSDSVDQFNAPRVVAKPEEKGKTKKYSNVDTSAMKMALHSVSRTPRNSDSEGSERRPFIAAHFHGNTSHLNPEIHENYKGNGLLRVSHDAPHDVWYPSDWTIASPHPHPTLTRGGHVRVRHTGVYLVYVQIYYLDSHDVISWVLHRTNADTEGRDTLLQCAQSSHSSEPLEKPNSCFSAAALFLKNGDKLAVRNTGGDRHSLMQPEKSFIGLIKLADAEDPDQDM